MTSVLCLSLIALATIPVHAVASQTESSVKILVVDIDDVGFDLLRETPTPTLDALEQHGRFFTSFSSSPMCSPTRAMFNLGAYPLNPDVLIGRIIRSDDPYSMPLDGLEPLATLVVDHGRSTAKIGKWHLCATTAHAHPNDAGWQHYAGAMSNVPAASQSFFDFDKVMNGVVSRVTGHYLTSDETDDAISAVQAGVDLISVSYHAPHAPFHEPPAGLYTLPIPTTNRDMARAMLEACDTELRRLLAEAIPLGYTVFVFADNGTAGSIGGQKGSVRDGGVIVPMWAYGPGVRPGRDSSPVGAVDLYATIADLFGIPTGPLQGHPRRGPNSRSLVPELNGVPGPRRANYAEMFLGNGVDPRVSGGIWHRMLRGERYKLVRIPFVGEQFFDLENDPAETVNLIGTSLSAREQLTIDAFRWTFDRL